MGRTRDGDPADFADFYERNAALAYGLAIRIVGRERAEDVTQEAFLTVWRSRGQYTAELSGARSWLLTIVRRRAIDALRREGARPRTLVLEGAETVGTDRLRGAETGSPAVAVVERDEARVVRHALTSIPPDQRQALELAYFNGLAHSEIAERLGLPLGTVKGRIRHGLVKLHDRLSDAGVCR
ncbi:MAG TPA: sigma-70 family RNA polymerase sigma factor [Thermoleophilaceae bacterium]|jgi:RNA polymerase sigma-70 factor (ECF subfamily)